MVRRLLSSILCIVSLCSTVFAIQQKTKAPKLPPRSDGSKNATPQTAAITTTQTSATPNPTKLL